MEHGSPSRRLWADEVEEAELVARSPSAGLNPNAEPFLSAPSGLGRGERLSFTDSEASFGSEAPSPAANVKGKGPAPDSAHRRRPRHRRRQYRWGGYMADARRSYRRADAAFPPPAGRLRSLVVHPVRLSTEPDTDRYREVHSCRRWHRRPSPTVAKPVPVDLIGLCFNCLGDDHVKAVC